MLARTRELGGVDGGVDLVVDVRSLGVGLGSVRRRERDAHVGLDSCEEQEQARDDW